MLLAIEGPRIHNLSGPRDRLEIQLVASNLRHHNAVIGSNPAAISGEAFGFEYRNSSELPTKS